MNASNILVLGGGTAGFLSALTLRRCLPSARITVLQSSKLGIIGVGEGSLRQLPGFLHSYLGIDPRRFFAEVGPTWKLGIRFLWGERGDFNYSFSPQLDVTHPHPDLPRPIGYYCFDDMEDHCVASVMMRADQVFLRDEAGRPQLGQDVGYHLDNRRFAAFLETYAREQGVALIDDRVVDVEADETGVTGLLLESGARVGADLFVDCSGFASLLLGKTLREPFISYQQSLFCDRAVIGGWERGDEALHPYTTSETMAAGWSWQIEHETRINRGYVYASSFIDDDAAEAEFRRANPRVTDTGIVRFRAGRYRHAWNRNVVAIGNAAGFVEPLEATAIAAICSAARAVAESLSESEAHVTPTVRQQFNDWNARSWDSIADFLAVHYKFNSRVDNAFWRACRSDVDLRGAAPIVDFYRENGPSQLWRLTLEDPICRFRLDGYYTLLVGQKVPHARLGIAGERELAAWHKLRAATRRYPAAAFTVPEALDIVRSPQWEWRDEHFQDIA
ncbi:MAG: tryptophan halogenase family protein [Gammaproteobacteria bacterium]